MVATELTSPPALDEFELSLFGPGVGECVVVHLGHGDWMVVDSCNDPSTGKPIALAYLEGMGVDLARVRLVVVTHWHDDHIKGVGSLFTALPNAKLACGVVLQGEEFFEMLAVAEKRDSINDPSGVSEFVAIFKELTERLSPGSRRANATPIWAIAGRPIFAEGDGSTLREVEALSPSDVAVKLGKLQLGAELEEFRAAKAGRRAVAVEPNEAAVALWIRTGDVHLLLGADLEESTDPQDGWQVITANSRPRKNAWKACVFKVAHHGSATGHNADVWTHLLEADAHAVVTPFRRQKLPRPDDVDRLRNSTANLHFTADPEKTNKRPPKRAGAVDRTMNGIATKREVKWGPVGHVRLRGKLSGGEPVVRVFDGAYKVP